MGIVLLLVGYMAGLFGSPNILLPLLWAWPRARKLRQEGRLEAIPFTRFVLAPIIWTALLVGSSLLVQFMTDDASTYVFGILVATFQTGRLVFSPNEAMDADFNDTYGGYFRGRPAADPMLDVDD